MMILYDILFFFYVLFSLPIVALKGKWHDGMGERLGFLSDDLKERLSGKNNIWVHAVSVGEVLAIQGVLGRLKKDYPLCKIVLSVSTKTGYFLAQHKYREDLIVVWSPLDFSWTVKAFVVAIRPQVYIAAETELWPNLFWHLQKEHIPMLVINARISDKAYPQYLKIKPFLRGTLEAVSAFCVQSKLDEDRLVSLGANPDSVEDVGNLKFDNVPSPKKSVREDVTFLQGQKVLLGASTHAGEDEILLDVYCSLRKTRPELRLVLAPRHPERAVKIADVIKRSGLNPVLFSNGVKGLSDEDVLVVDTIGHLMSLYRLANVVFVGKSLTAHGGHNIIEPALFSKPIIIGPFMENFRDVTQAFLDEKAIIQLQGAACLDEVVESLLDDPQKAERLGEKAYAVVHAHGGAIERTMQTIGRYVKL